MKLIQKFFDSQKKYFEKGQKLEKYYPIFEAFETFCFAPGTATEKSPHVRDSIDLKRFMSVVFIALIPPLLWGIYNTGYMANMVSGLNTNIVYSFIRGLKIVFPIIIVSYGVGFFWEIIFAVIRKHKISEGFLITGILFPLTLPPTIPLWQVAVGISFGVVIGKEVFGGTGRNILNPALTARAFIFFAYPTKISGQVWTVMDGAKQEIIDTFTGATPLAIAALVKGSEKIEHSLNIQNYTFSKLFLGSYAGSIGETSTLLCIIGAIILIITGIASYQIIISGIIGALVTGYFLNIFSSSPWTSLNPFYHLVMGSFAFGITYMATDPVSGPGLNIGKWIYGFLIGMLTILIRVFNPAYTEGTMLAILFMNLFAPLIDYIEIKIKIKKRVPNV